MSIEQLYSEIQHVIEATRIRVYRTVNSSMVQSYWEIGRLIVVEEQKGADRAAKGETGGEKEKVLREEAK